MLCIAAFIILLVVGIFSARYRKYLKKAASCTFRRITFRPCDTTFKQDLKDGMLAPLAARQPALVKPASILIEVLAVLVVLTTVWSLYTGGKAILNLWVYGTCDKQNSESCTLGAESCSVGDATPTFMESLGSFDVIGAFGNEFASLSETIAAVPTRLRDWKAEEYLPSSASYLRTFDASKPTAIEIIDPGCRFCRQLFENIEEAGFDEEYNLSYIAFPIESDGGYKFANSLLVTQYLEALRLHPLDSAATPVDWQVLSHIFLDDDENGTSYQSVINNRPAAEVTAVLHRWLAEAGMTPEQIEMVAAEAASDTVAAVIAENRELVRVTIGTVMIPTMIFDGRRHDGLVGVDGLR
jgi:hypothetical protein